MPSLPRSEDAKSKSRKRKNPCQEGFVPDKRKGAEGKCRYYCPPGFQEHQVGGVYSCVPRPGAAAERRPRIPKNAARTYCPTDFKPLRDGGCVRKKPYASPLPLGPPGRPLDRLVTSLNETDTNLSLLLTKDDVGAVEARHYRSFQIDLLALKEALLDAETQLQHVTNGDYSLNTPELFVEDLL